MTSTTGTEIDWDRATEECVALLRALIRIPSVNPPGTPDGAAGLDSTGGETAAAAYCAEVLTGAGIGAEVLEAVPGRGSCFARLRATVPSPQPPLILLSHLDVVPVEAEAWSRDPFAAELVDGVVWGRGAVDMKDMVAMELAVMLALHRSGGELRRDVIFAAVADEEAGCDHGSRFLVEQHPDLVRAEYALGEVGGFTMHLAGTAFYPVQVAEKGLCWVRARFTGEPGHGSMPRRDSAVIRMGEALARLGEARFP
ncbi:MAG: M20/M25/M40 family metallo-hydrolase, partial [Candidatus Limnocylindria bacterium]